MVANITQEQIDEAARSFCMPLTLLINFSLFQYLVTLYYKRRRELRGSLLLICAFLSVAAIIPFASSTSKVMGQHLNNISETASTITFLIQIVLMSRDITRKIKIPSTRVVLVTSELITFTELGVLVLEFVALVKPSFNSKLVDAVYDGLQNAALVFIFIARFYFVVVAHGWHYILRNEKLELVLYTLFATHEYPFRLLEDRTGLWWGQVEATWHRLTLALCVSRAVHKNLVSSSRHTHSKVTSAPMIAGPQVSTLKITAAKSILPRVRQLSVNSLVVPSQKRHRRSL